MRDALATGLRGLGAHVDVWDGRPEGSLPPFDSIKPGSLLVWIGNAGWNKQVSWKKLAEQRKRGVVVVYYQSEPLGVAGRVDDQAMDEEWHYSIANIDYARRIDPDANRTIRHVPTAAMAPVSSTRFTFNRSRTRTEKLQLTLFGQTRMREGCYPALKSQLKERLKNEFGVHDRIQFARFVASNDGVFVEMPRMCPAMEETTPRYPVPGVRMSQLLSFGGLVISTRAYHKDEAKYKGLITFTSRAGIVREFAKLAALSSEQREQLSRSRETAYRARFDPVGVLRSAGVMSLLRGLA
jgi:hypothetical protein